MTKRTQSPNYQQQRADEAACAASDALLAKPAMPFRPKNFRDLYSKQAEASRGRGGKRGGRSKYVDHVLEQITFPEDDL